MNIVFIFVKSMFFGVPEEMQEKNGIYEKAGTEASPGKIWWNYMVSAQWKRLPPDAGNRGQESIIVSCSVKIPEKF